MNQPNTLGNTQPQPDDKIYRIENSMWTTLDIVDRCVQRVELLERRIHNLEAKILRDDIRTIAQEINSRKQTRLIRGKR